MKRLSNDCLGNAGVSPLFTVSQLEGGGGMASVALLGSMSLFRGLGGVLYAAGRVILLLLSSWGTLRRSM
jgi:hypothetical protein